MTDPIEDFLESTPDTLEEPKELIPPYDEADVECLKGRIIAALRLIYDPEIPVNIYDLGLIYDVRIDEEGTVNIDMTLTSPGCPVAQTFPGVVEKNVMEVQGVSEATVEAGGRQ